MDPDAFIAQVTRSPVSRAFFHFTDASNLPSIREHGLLSIRELRHRGIAIPAPGGNEWSQDADIRFGVDGYVHLALKTGHPMGRRAVDDGRIKMLQYVGVDPEVIRLPGVVGTLDVANKSGVSPVSLAEFLDKLDHEVLYTRTRWDDPAINARLQIAQKCELLVPNEIALKFLTIP